MDKTSCILSTIMKTNRNLEFKRKNILKREFYCNIKSITTHNIVVNLSDSPLSRAHLDVLNKGLKFVPTPTTVNIKQCVTEAFEKLRNRMSTIYHFHKNLQPYNPLHRKTNWIAPKPKNKHLLNYFDFLKNDLEIFNNEVFTITNKKCNLTPEEKHCLRNLSKNDNIVIKKADKGGSIVIMNREDYLKKVYEHLDNENYYRKINKDPTKDLITNINSFIESAVKHYHISRDTAKFITPTDNPRISLFYILPKIHKKDTPGRPIVSAVSCVTENMSEFINLCLQPLLPKLRSYVKDTKHFVSIMTKLPRQNKNVLLVSADVVSLYTNIPHDEGIEACIYYTKRFKNVLPQFTPNERILRTLLLFILENNYFEFLDQMFLQLIGTAMGTKAAPPYASLFLGSFEEKHIFSKFSRLLTIFVRFLDDIFLIWEHGEEELHRFFKHLNSVHPTIKFTYEFSKTEINFLDTTVYIDKHTRKIKTKLFVKPSDTRTLLHNDSYHPDHTKHSIVYSQALRYRMVTTDDDILLQNLNELKTNLICRGYNSQIIDLMFSKAMQHTQQSVLNCTMKKGNNEFRVRKNETVRHIKSEEKTGNTILPFVIPYHDNFPHLTEALHRSWYIINNDENLRTIFPKKPFLSFTRHQNIQDQLIRTKMKL